MDSLSLASELRLVTGLAVTELSPLWDLAPSDLVSAVPDVIPAVVDSWSLAAASAAADWYDTLREEASVSGRFRAIVAPLTDELGAEALVGWVMQALTADAVDAARKRAESGVQKRVVNAANHTITNSAQQDPKARGYQRHARADGCDFCRMVATRKPVYTRASVTFACHEGCHCYASPAFDGTEIAVRHYQPSDRSMSPEARANLNASARAWIKANL